MNASPNHYDVDSALERLHSAYSSLSEGQLSESGIEEVTAIYPLIVGDEALRSEIRDSDVFEIYSDPVEVYYDLALAFQEKVVEGITGRLGLMDVWEARSYGRHNGRPGYIERTDTLLEGFFGKSVEYVDSFLEGDVLDYFEDESLESGLESIERKLDRGEGYGWQEDLDPEVENLEQGTPIRALVAGSFSYDDKFREGRSTPWREVALVTGGIDLIQQNTEMRSVLGNVRTPVSRWNIGFYVGGRTVQERKGEEEF